MNISTVSEFELIARLTSGLAAHSSDLGIGDDCAVLDLGNETLLLATCDSQVEGIHFTRQTSSPEDIGRKALAINLSDIAAMGGTPRYALISLILPRHLPLAILDGVYAGLREIAEEYGVTIVGGNIAGAGTSELLIIDITLLGSIERGHVLMRSGASVGDILCVTGELGNSAAGLYVLQHPDLSVSAVPLDFVRNAHTAPRPRVQEGQLLSAFGPAVVTALLDISDGVSGDLRHLCESSNVGASIDMARLPLSLAMRAIASSAAIEPLDWALHGGEDYELLFTVTPEQVEAVCTHIQTETGTPVTVIGMILPSAEAIKIHKLDGSEEALSIKSWDHLKS